MKVQLLQDSWGHISNYTTYGTFGKLLQVNKAVSTALWASVPEHIAKRIAHFVPEKLFKLKLSYFDHFQIMLNATTRDYTFCLHVGKNLKKDPRFKTIIKNSLASLILAQSTKAATKNIDIPKEIEQLIQNTCTKDKIDTFIYKLSQILYPEKENASELNFNIDDLLKIRSVAKAALSNSKIFLSTCEGNPSQRDARKKILALHPNDAELEL